MSDLVQRLRALVILDEMRSDNPLGREAADRIETLEVEVRRYAAEAVQANTRVEALEAALEAMCLNMKNDGHAYRDCYIRARAILAPEQNR